MAEFFSWCILFIICWPRGSTGHRTISGPSWLITLRFRILVIAVHGVFALARRQFCFSRGDVSCSPTII